MLQEKIDKLPLSIEHQRRTYKLRFGGNSEYIFVEYFDKTCLGDYSGLFEIYNEDLNQSLPQRLEDVIDRALTIIENKEWKK